MELKIRNVPDEVLVTLDQQAKKQNLSREEYVRRILFSASLNTHDNHLHHFRTEVMQKLAEQIEHTNQIIQLVGGRVNGEK